MDNVIETYRNEDGDTLREYTHMERPWRETRGMLKEGESDNKTIPNSLIGTYPKGYDREIEKKVYDFFS